MPKQLATSDKNWYIIDATGLTLWRLATRLAVILKGKHKVDYAPHVDNGDYIIVTNADKFRVTWKKLTDKMYYTHSGYLGGLKEIALEDMLVKKPSKALQLAVSGMLPKNKLRANMLQRLKLVEWTDHKFAAQTPTSITI